MSLVDLLNESATLLAESDKAVGESRILDVRDEVSSDLHAAIQKTMRQLKGDPDYAELVSLLSGAKIKLDKVKMIGPNFHAGFGMPVKQNDKVDEAANLVWHYVLGEVSKAMSRRGYAFVDYGSMMSKDWETPEGVEIQVALDLGVPGKWGGFSVAISAKHAPEVSMSRALKVLRAKLGDHFEFEMIGKERPAIVLKDGVVMKD